MRGPTGDRGARGAGALLLAGCILLSACGSAPPRPAEGPRKPGGYYLDDGPQPNPPADLDRVPDAQARLEPIRAANARPYIAMGRTYTPMTELGPYRATGKASWYGRRYHGKPTASGEIYDMYAMTAAHPILPIPSYARVRNLQSGRAVLVRINDRGPFHPDRVIDLSYTAAYKLGILADGSATVEVESIVPGKDAAPSASGWRTGDVRAPQSAVPAHAVAPLSQEAAGVYVQLGAFSVRGNAEAFAARLQAELGWLAEAIGLYQAGGMFRVRAGPYPDRDAAQRAAVRIERALDLKPIVIDN
jgi:rare lipoprotein A